MNYFDKPRSVPQLLWVNSFGRCAKLDIGRLVPRPRAAELDWNRIPALLVP